MIQSLAVPGSLHAITLPLRWPIYARRTRSRPGGERDEKYECDRWAVDNFASYRILTNCGTKIAVEGEATNKARGVFFLKKKKKMDGCATLHSICVDSMTLNLTNVFIFHSL